ncbi:hypothetical protein B0H19DRAFT_1059981 [Mycena capillaripes]|nr:hypothetical protein B0H19DRAFT_1059981 [Mycena capillaripes]
MAAMKTSASSTRSSDSLKSKHKKDKEDGKHKLVSLENMRWSHPAPPDGSSGMRGRVANITCVVVFSGPASVLTCPPNDVATRHRMPDEPSGGAGWLHRMFSIVQISNTGQPQM